LNETSCDDNTSYNNINIGHNFAGNIRSHMAYNIGGNISDNVVYNIIDKIKDIIADIVVGNNTDKVEGNIAEFMESDLLSWFYVKHCLRLATT